MHLVRAISTVVLLTAGSALGAPILAVDAGLTTSPVQSGFVAFGMANPAGSSSVTKTYTGLSGVASGEIAMTIYGTAQLGGRDRTAISGAPAEFTYHDLYRDLATQLIESSTGASVTIQLTGLDPTTQYSIQIWSNDRGFNNNAVYRWWDRTSGTAVLLGSITNIQPTPASAYTSNDVFSIQATVTSDATGALRLSHDDSGGVGTFNGLTISAVPEPTSLMVFGMGAAALIRRRR